jgi:uncharacterized membrane protein YjjP (DUF1212 family)
MAAAAVSTELRLLQLAARLLLEYNVRCKTLERQIARLAAHLGVGVRTAIAYRNATLFIEGGMPLHVQVPELRMNVAISSGTRGVIDALCGGRIEPAAAEQRLAQLQRMPPQYGRWVLATLVGLAASALAWILRADAAATAASGVSAALGLIVRQELGKRHVMLFALPLAAAFIGAVIAGLVIRLGWTVTPELCLIVPALMLVPGPHLINGVDDILDNHVATGLARLGLASGIIMAAAIGVLLGRYVTLGDASLAATTFEGLPLTLLLDVVLAGIAACGFGAFYNTPGRVLSVAVAGGMAGHGVRYVCLAEGVGLSVATLFGCLAIGAVAAAARERLGLPFADVAFAGAVTMMPGALIYESIAGVVQMAAQHGAADPALTAATLALLFKALFVVGAMAIGLLVGARVLALAYRQAGAA